MDDITIVRDRYFLDPLEVDSDIGGIGRKSHVGSGVSRSIHSYQNNNTTQTTGFDQKGETSKEEEEVASLGFSWYIQTKPRPQNTKLSAVYFLVHGGAWLTGSPDNLNTMAKYIAQRGYVVVAAGYQIPSIEVRHLHQVLALEMVVLIVLLLLFNSSEHMVMLLITIMVFLTLFVLRIIYTRRKPKRAAKFPSHIIDIASNFAHVYRTCHLHGGDNQHIHVVGHSAGGHLVSMLLADDKYLNRHNLCPRANIASATLISAVLSRDRLLSSAGYVFHYLVFQQQSNAGDNNTFNDSDVRSFPLYHIALMDDMDTKTLPPVLLLTSNADFSLVLHSHDMYYTLKDKDCEVAWYHYNTNHFSIKTHTPALETVLSFSEYL